MLLQPLVENAIGHGVAVKPGRGVIRVSARRLGDHVVFEVADSGPGFKTAGPSSSGVGLSSTESRLNLMYGEAHHIEYGRSDEGGALVTIFFPFTVAAAAPLPLMTSGVSV